MPQSHGRIIPEDPQGKIHLLMSYTGVVFMAIVLAWGLLKAYDLPVREWLKEHWLKR